MNRHEIRAELGRAFRTSQDFDAFCINFFGEVAVRFTSGQERTERENLLLQLIEPHRIVSALGQHLGRPLGAVGGGATAKSQERTEPISFVTSVQLTEDAMAVRNNPPVEEYPPPPGGPFSRQWYVPREDEESLALAQLRSPGSALIFYGPRYHGRTWLLQAVIQELHYQRHWSCIVLDLATMVPSEMRDLDSLCRALADGIARALGIPPRSVVRVFDEEENRNVASLNDFLMEEVHPWLKKRNRTMVVIGLDNADYLLGQPYQGQFFSWLRSWMSDDTPSSFHFVLSLATNLSCLVNTGTAPQTDDGRRRSQRGVKVEERSLFNLGEAIPVCELTLAQSNALASKFGYSPAEIQPLRELVRGHPHLLCAAMSRARVLQRPLTDVINPEKQTWAFGGYLQRMSQALAKAPRPLEMLQDIYREPKTYSRLSPEEKLLLEQNGLIDCQGTESAVLKLELYKWLFRSM